MNLLDALSNMAVTVSDGFTEHMDDGLIEDVKVSSVVTFNKGSVSFTYVLVLDTTVVTIRFNTDFVAFNIKRGELTYSGRTFNFIVDYQGCTLSESNMGDHADYEHALYLMTRHIAQVVIQQDPFNQLAK